MRFSKLTGGFMGLLPLFFGLVMSVTALADEFEEGIAAHDKGDYTTAIKLLRPLAEQGNVAAQAGLGFMYNLGQGTEPDYNQAVLWFRKAAEQGNANAQSGLGFSYQNGQGVPQNSQEAAKWYRLAAEQGLPVAQSKLGQLYKNGEGVAQDTAKAYLWLSLASEHVTEAVQMRDEVAMNMTSAQLAKAKELATTCRTTVFKICD